MRRPVIDGFSEAVVSLPLRNTWTSAANLAGQVPTRRKLDGQLIDGVAVTEHDQIDLIEHRPERKVDGADLGSHIAVFAFPFQNSALYKAANSFRVQDDDVFVVALVAVRRCVLGDPTPRWSAPAGPTMNTLSMELSFPGIDSHRNASVGQFGELAEGPVLR